MNTPGGPKLPDNSNPENHETTLNEFLTSIENEFKNRGYEVTMSEVIVDTKSCKTYVATIIREGVSLPIVLTWGENSDYNSIAKAQKNTIEQVGKGPMRGITYFNFGINIPQIIFNGIRDANKIVKGLMLDQVIVVADQRLASLMKPFMRDLVGDTGLRIRRITSTTAEDAVKKMKRLIEHPELMQEDMEEFSEMNEA